MEKQPEAMQELNAQYNTLCAKIGDLLIKKRQEDLGSQEKLAALYAEGEQLVTKAVELMKAQTEKKEQVTDAELPVPPAAA